MKKKAIKKKDFTTPYTRIERVYNQMIDYMETHNTNKVNIVKDDSFFNIPDIAIKKEDLESPIVQKFLCKMEKTYRELDAGQAPSFLKDKKV